MPELQSPEGSDLFDQRPCADPDLWNAFANQAFEKRNLRHGHDFNGHDTELSTALKAACLTCPVRQACLDMAMEFERGSASAGRYGIFGGLDPWERASYARQHGITGPNWNFNQDYCAEGHSKAIYGRRGGGEDRERCGACIDLVIGVSPRTRAEYKEEQREKRVMEGGRRL